MLLISKVSTLLSVILVLMICNDCQSTHRGGLCIRFGLLKADVMHIKICLRYFKDNYFIKTDHYDLLLDISYLLCLDQMLSIGIFF